MSTSSSVSDQTFTGVANLIKLLPTGTFFLFQFLNPLVTDNGHCSTLNKTLEALLLVFCAFACWFSSFTDGYTGSDGKTHYGIVTATGIWPSPSSDNVDLSKYKLWFGDFVHAFFSVIVFANLALLDSNTVRCLYPEFESAQKILLEALPPTLGLVSVNVFLFFLIIAMELAILQVMIIKVFLHRLLQLKPNLVDIDYGLIIGLIALKV